MYPSFQRGLAQQQLTVMLKWIVAGLLYTGCWSNCIHRPGDVSARTLTRGRFGLSVFASAFACQANFCGSVGGSVGRSLVCTKPR